MTTHTQHARYLLPLAYLVGAIGLGSVGPVQAQMEDEGGAAGLQNASTGVNDSGIVVGTARAGNSSSPAQAWVALTSGTETVLPALVSGQSCGATMIADSGTIVGSCLDANGRPQAVTWNANNPTVGPQQLQPIGGQYVTVASGVNQGGVVIGASIAQNGDAAPVLWPAGSTTPISVTGILPMLNCVPVDVSDVNVNGGPVVTVDCPSPTDPGTMEGAIAVEGLLGYAVTYLALPANAKTCIATGMVNTNVTSVQVGGTCYINGTPQAAYWANASNPPTLLSGTDSSGTAIVRSGGAFINNSGNMLFAYQNASGIRNVGYWNPVANTPPHYAARS